MNEKIIDLYNDACEEYGRSAVEARTVVNEAISELSLSVRPDARLFLIVNFDQLVLNPYRKAAPKFDAVGMLADDVRVILRCARGIALDRGREMITAREIVEATGITWRSVLTHVNPVPEG